MSRRTVVKVCGLTNADDAAWALGCGADWLGFIVNGESPRRIEPDDAAAIVQAAGGGVPVAVMVSVTPEEALDLARRARAERVQLHRVSPQGWPADFPLPCSFALGVTGHGELVGEEPGPQHLVLLDTHVTGQAGGTGLTWPWGTARPIAARRDVMLAGGLSGDNVGEAIRVVRPFGVDASSALESSPGRKDRERVRRYIEAARVAERLLEDAS
jgi:phosphoribosylanthranilate isomerase